MSERTPKVSNLNTKPGKHLNTGPKYSPFLRVISQISFKDDLKSFNFHFRMFLEQYIYFIEINMYAINPSLGYMEIIWQSDKR